MYLLKFTRIKFLLLILSFLLVSGSLLQAQKDKELQFFAQPDYEKTGLYLMWFMDDTHKSPEGVNVYYQEGAFYDISEMTDAQPFASLTKGDWTYERGMYQAYQNHNFKGGYYTFYIVVKFSDGTSKTSNTSPVNFSNVEPERYLEFTSVPNEKAIVGQKYEYTAKAVDPEDLNAEIEYYLNSGPKSMTINKTTGEISWTPDAKGYFEVWIQAISKTDPNVYGEQYFNINVFACSKPAIISGTITDSENKLVTNGFMQFISEDSKDYPDGRGNNFYTVVENGKYSLEVDEGKYYAIFQDFYGFFQYYPEAFDWDKAELITVKCEDNLTIDMKLVDYKNPSIFTVKGSVKTEDGNPVPYTSVHFEALNDGNEPGKNTYFDAFTDEEGNYETQLPDNYTYIAYIDAYWDPVTGISKTLYYNQTYNRDEAEKIKLSSDISGIDFILSKDNEFKYYTVSGKVTKEDGSPVENATVVFEGLYNEPTRKNPYWGNQTQTDAEGNYSLELPELFQYKAYVVTMNSFLYRPLYYKQTYDYEQAEVIALTEDKSGIDFVLSEPNFKMFKVSGKVTREDGSPIVSAMVMFEGFNDSPDYYYNRWSLSAFTDNEGKYEIELPEIFKYIAYSFDADIYDKYRCQMPLYYKQTYNPEQATIIELKDNLSDIDFVFGDTPSNYKSSLSGRVIDESGNALDGIYLMVYNVNSDNADPSGMYDGRATISGMNGEFKFISLMPGPYVLLAVPKTLDNVPGFYKKGSTVVLNWDEATIIDVKENENIDGIEVILGALGEAKNADMGICQVTGTVKAISNANQNKVPVAGAVIYTENSEGKIQKYATTSNDGSFNLKNLPTGSIMLKVEKLGYQPYSKNINFDGNKNNNDIGEILLTPEPLKVNDGTTNISSMLTYPNPVKDRLNVSFESRTDNVQVSLINSVGKMIWTSSLKTVRGSNNLTLDVSGYANGAYFVIIDNGKYSTAHPITIQR
jgi:protocatechuate 3,4-dioxygenase beta subunit